MALEARAAAAARHRRRRDPAAALHAAPAVPTSAPAAKPPRRRRPAVACELRAVAAARSQAPAAGGVPSAARHSARPAGLRGGRRAGAGSERPTIYRARRRLRRVARSALRLLVIAGVAIAFGLHRLQRELRASGSAPRARAGRGGASSTRPATPGAAHTRSPQLRGQPRPRRRGRRHQNASLGQGAYVLYPAARETQAREVARLIPGLSPTVAPIQPQVQSAVGPARRDRRRARLIQLPAPTARSRAGRRSLIGDQALAREPLAASSSVVSAGGRITSELASSSSPSARAARAHEVEQLRVGALEAVLVAALDRREHGSSSSSARAASSSVQPELVLARDPHDHALPRLSSGRRRPRLRRRSLVRAAAGSPAPARRARRRSPALRCRARSSSSSFRRRPRTGS